MKLAVLLMFHVELTESEIKCLLSPPPPGIENLPFELQRNFNLMRDLDQRTEGENNEMCNYC